MRVTRGVISIRLSAQALLFCTMTLIINLIRIPEATKIFWAEDARTYYQTALSHDFPKDFLQDTGGGYLNFISRIIGRLLTLFSIEIVTFANFLFVCIVTGLCAWLVYRMTDYIKAKELRLILSMSILMLPISTFDVIATSVNLHFIINFVLFLSLIHSTSTAESRLHSILIVPMIIIATLSGPLSVFCLFYLFTKRLPKRGLLQPTNYNLVEKTFMFTLLFHYIYIALRVFDGGRARGNESNILKTSYLYLERVVGPQFIPFWGHISAQDYESRNLLFFIARGTAGLIILGFLVALLLYSHKHIDRESAFPILVSKAIFAAGSSYWFFVGMVFNPEPRYAVFPAFCLLTASCIWIDKISHLKNGIIIKFTLIFTILLTWTSSWKPETFRTQGKNWNVQLVEASTFCSQNPSGTFRFEIEPYEYMKLPISCSLIQK